MVEFIALIYENACNDHSKLLEYIRIRFLQICNSSRGYKFQILLYSDKNSDTNIIVSILEMDEIKHCSNVEIGIIFGEQKRLLVDEISNWLEPSADGMKNNLQNQERFLNIYYIPAFFQNTREMLEHLAKVYFIYFMAHYLFIILWLIFLIFKCSAWQ